jgi:hypothetical protein
MSILLDHSELDCPPELHAAAVSALGDVTADQALGLRLIALARTAAAMHMGAGFADRAVDRAQPAHELRGRSASMPESLFSPASPSLADSQAAGLLALLSAAAGCSTLTEGAAR